MKDTGERQEGLSLCLGTCLGLSAWNWASRRDGMPGCSTGQ